MAYEEVESKSRELAVDYEVLDHRLKVRRPIRVITLIVTLIRENDEVATVWLNNESVRAAIHAQPKNVIGEWILCTGNIYFIHDAGSMITYHKNLTSLGYRALIFSGDHDMCVPFTGSEAWTRSLGYQVVDKWRPWCFGHQVAGYIQGYEHNLIFLTVKAAGHTVAEYKPQEALALYTRWLNGQSI